jgi:glycosyltransferase involved in cell wall biosynthesis
MTTLVASVVVPVRGRSDDLRRCLERLIVQRDVADFEILVCDDGSNDEDAERIRETAAADDRIRYLRQPPRGPAAARNLGVSCALAPIVAFTDSDTLPEPGWLAAILEPFKEPNVVAVEGAVRTPAPADSPLEEAPRNDKGGVFLTANMAYRRDALLEVGGLDESFPYPAFEDVDLALCVQKLGEFRFAKNAVVLHPWRKMTLQSSLKRLRHLDWLLVTALRHGCLGWTERPTKRPRLRVAIAAALTLPLGRIRKGMRYFFQSPSDSVQRIGIAAVEAAIGVAMLPRWFRKEYPVKRRMYLQPEARRPMELAA